MQIRKTIRIEEAVMNDITAIACEENQSENLTIETALKFYRDYYHMKHKATFINEDILKAMTATVSVGLQSVNAKTNQVLSELAIQSSITNQILANELEVNPLALQSYRTRAVEFLKANNRVLRLDEIAE